MFEWIADMIARAGYLGVALLMLAENLFPPIPSELIMPLAGFVAARGELGLPGVIAAGALGSILGALPWYWAGHAFGPNRLKSLTQRHSRWLTISPRDVDRACTWFDRYGRSAVLVGRLVPTVRTLISVPAGLAHMPLGPFLAWSSVGTFTWTALLAGAGYLLEGHYGQVASYLDPVSKAVLALIVLTYLYRLVTIRSEGNDRPT
jgi:membrane protein DedA with SNARE-associated domain